MDKLDLQSGWIYAVSVPDRVTRNIDLIRIIKRMRRFHSIEASFADELHKRYSLVNNVSSDIWAMFVYDVSCTSFQKFLFVLEDCGYLRLFESLNKCKLPHEEKLRKYYAQIKSLIDDEAFKGGSHLFLETQLHRLQHTIAKSDKNAVNLQYLVDKQSLLFNLYTHTCSDLDSRLTVLKRMRDKTPHFVNRDLFDVYFHCSMALICAAKGDIATVEKHKEIVDSVCAKVSSLFLSIIRATAYLYLDGKQSKPSDLSYMQCINLSTEFPDDEIEIYIDIPRLQRTHALLGIRWNFVVTDIQDVSTENLVTARDILKQMKEPKTVRRRMWYFMCKGRLCEISDVDKALTYVQQAVELASDPQEKTNIVDYLQRLSRSEPAIK